MNQVIGDMSNLGPAKPVPASTSLTEFSTLVSNLVVIYLNPVQEIHTLAVAYCSLDSLILLDCMLTRNP